MIKHIFLFMFCLSLGAQQPGSVQQRLLGAWDLVSYEVRTPAGTTMKPLGDDPVGRIFYDAAGHISAHLMRRGIPRFASEDRSKATDPEMGAAWQGYAGYFGRYTVDEKTNTVNHQVEGAWFPNYVGTRQVRVYKFEGNDRLILQAKQAWGVATIVWKRSK